MSFLVLRAYWNLLSFDLRIATGNFAALYRKVRECPIAKRAPSFATLERISSALELASIWYPKEILCLQRSAAAACLLRKYGIPAQMVIGAKQMPFKAHAWVEVQGCVVTDKPYVADIYAVLDRC